MEKTSLGAYLRRLPGREQVQVVVMDLSETYSRMIDFSSQSAATGEVDC